MRLNVPASDNLPGGCCHSSGPAGRSGSGELNICVNSPGPLERGGAGGRPGSGIGDFGGPWNMPVNWPGAEAGAALEGVVGLTGCALNEAVGPPGCWGGAGCCGGRAPVRKSCVNSPGAEAVGLLDGAAGCPLNEAVGPSGCRGGTGGTGCCWVGVRAPAWNICVNSPGPDEVGELDGAAGLAGGALNEPEGPPGCGGGTGFCWVGVRAPA
jgi:hypothetical protein